MVALRSTFALVDNPVPVVYSVTVVTVPDFVYVTKVNVYSGGEFAKVQPEGLRNLLT